MKKNRKKKGVVAGSGVEKSGSGNGNGSGMEKSGNGVEKNGSGDQNNRDPALFGQLGVGVQPNGNVNSISVSVNEGVRNEEDGKRKMNEMDDGVLQEVEELEERERKKRKEE
ncbi:uncharacterized protein MELLADRAFT_72432 [Melampsora larici-populina 98AG31]|uniref:Uncharacterized protein n=1 Tax=Melampsora larici-populina (strain 98AG31 / pathotype 3-4-7) TaxID=747676 RepID=F4RTU7_MELLP|nr:uncharacterized protein MELLADRAFT_72432 [Melampsora larici-populina 98AG31]EGG04196.1 hypothetical protein MELLADRAFT_72432 [Melampsora larici-populina 98AG31]